MSGHDAPAAPANCENCATTLRGDYCHACGQSVHSPTRHFGHAVEEVFESFWHLDGRVFRTLRDLMVPGRVARNYLAGQRVRYIAPMRLFVILSLLTFFIGKLVIHVDEAPIRFGGEGGEAIAQAQTVEEVRQIEDRLLEKLSVAEAEANKVPGVNAALIATRARIQGAAANRIVELEAAQSGAGGAGMQGASPQGAAPPAEAAAPAKAPASADTPGPAARSSHQRRGRIHFNDRPWDAKTNPVNVPFLPDFADRWLNRKIGRAQANLTRMDENPDLALQAMLGAVPTALFLLMPVFALLLKVLYLGSGRGYLEHAVVALYSHAWLLLVLMAMFMLSAADDAFAATWVQVTTALANAALWIAVPVYLFMMQHRVYGQHWTITTLKYVLIGSVYVVLVSLAALYAVLAGLTS